MHTPTFEKELTLRLEGEAFIIGIDEAGRGPLAGPVVAAAVCYRTANFSVPEALAKEFSLIRDSKKLSPKQREKAFSLVQEHFHVGTGIINPETIDRVNILQATFLAMKAALTDLLRQLPEARGKEYLLIDGNQPLPSFSGTQEAVIGGDSLVRSIAAASIVAKVTRDRMFDEYEALYPGYGFVQHKGYGTKVHMDALRHLGPCAIHRQSFRPVQLTNPETVNRKFASVLQRKKR
ncbi:MAG: ribonuclease HII [Candidatus Moranbacteria bacterium RIFCSPHIGHO2_01_FULL_55_24]|nr:MAG: ribonuclease HII [Candidatus Moranbacteria bacterium RIFCSPHIGHO2_01_FULL_55_24]